MHRSRTLALVSFIVGTAGIGCGGGGAPAADIDAGIDGSESLDAGGGRDGGTDAPFAGDAGADAFPDASGDAMATADAGSDGGGDLCGDGVVTAGERCDVAVPAGDPGACPTSCADADACTLDALSGEACLVTCTHEVVTSVGPDGCCPSGATIATDEDCPVRCGDGVVSAGESCDSAIGSGMPGSCSYMPPRLTGPLATFDSPCVFDWRAEAFPGSGCSNLGDVVPFRSVTCELIDGDTGAVIASRSGAACGATATADPADGFMSGTTNTSSWEAVIEATGPHTYRLDVVVTSHGGATALGSTTFVLGPSLCHPLPG